MTEDDGFEDYKRELIGYNLETLHFLSNEKKSDRERCVCAAFLRCLGLSFSTKELVPVPQEDGPPDVIFREACFEVCDSLTEGRKAHDETRKRVERLKKAKTLKDLDIELKFRTPITYSEAYHYVTDELTKKALRYGGATCANLDALVHMRRNVCLRLDSPPPSCALFPKQGWRSVSFVLPPHSHVIYAAGQAPAFLREAIGQTLRKWDDLHTVYDL
jgi:hypothetical protein